MNLLLKRTQQFKRRCLIRLLRKHNQNVRAVAKEIGMNRTHLYKAIRQLNIPFDFSANINRGKWDRDIPGYF